MLKNPIAKAQSIDLKKDKILMAGMALLAGLVAMVALSSSAHAKTPARKEWAAYAQGDEETFIPIKLRTQQFQH